MAQNLSMTEWQRINDELDRKRKNWQWLADELGVSIQLVHNWKIRRVPPKYFRAIATAIGKTVDWIEGLEGHAVREPAATYQIREPGKPYPKPELSDNILIPQYDTGGAMGHGLVLQGFAGVIHSMQVSREWVRLNLRQATKPENLCIVTGFGDSMRGIYNPGDPLIVDTGVKAVEFDAVYFFRVANEGFIKRLQRVPGEGLIAISENKSYRDWSIKPDMDFEVFGRVLKAWKSEDF